jgi:hypothetical protein
MAPQRDAWSEACQTMQVHGDLGPLAKLISGTSPIPPWVREYLGRMLDPTIDSKTFDRLVFHRSSEAKINQDKLAVAVAVHDRIRAGEPRKKAIGKVGEDFGVSRSYVEDAIAHEEKLAEKLPPLKYFWDFARSTQATFSPHRTGPRKKPQSTKT